MLPFERGSKARARHDKNLLPDDNFGFERRHDDDGSLVYDLSGSLDRISVKVEPITRIMTGLIHKDGFDPRISKIVVDLSQLLHIDSVGVRFLDGVYMDLDCMGVSVCFLDPQEPVAKILNAACIVDYRRTSESDL